MMKNQLAITPVLLGGDLNSYNMARAFHEKYGVISHVFGRYPVGPTKYSNILKFHRVENLDKPDVFVRVLRDFAESRPGSALILLACIDDYVTMIIQNKSALESAYIVPYIDEPLMEKLVRKADFYDACERFGIPYPKTVTADRDFPADRLAADALGFAYPIIIKPSYSAEYWAHPFDGMKKVYTAQNPGEAKAVMASIFASGYDDKIILQDLIPGDDSRMRVLTAYADKDGKTKMMAWGHVLLEEHTPRGIGNHAAIITAKPPELCAKIRRLLDDIGYRGFANFDLKYDERDGTFRAFEINLRQGRSNYYVTAAGINLAGLLVGDYILNSRLEYAETTGEHLWVSVPRGVVYKYVRDAKAVNTAKELVRRGDFSSSLWYGRDLFPDPRRAAWAAAHSARQFKKFEKYYPNPASARGK